jgi:hypothetical protein
MTELPFFLYSKISRNLDLPKYEIIILRRKKELKCPLTSDIIVGGARE